jgi:hypothetical protein
LNVFQPRLIGQTLYRSCQLDVLNNFSTTLPSKINFCSGLDATRNQQPDAEAAHKQSSFQKSKETKQRSLFYREFLNLT